MLPYEKWYEAKISEATDQAWRLVMNQRIVGPVHFYFKQGELIATMDKPALGEGWEIVTPEACPTNREKHQVRAWLWALGRMLPILPERFCQATR